MGMKQIVSEEISAATELPATTVPSWFITRAAVLQYDALFEGDGSEESLIDAAEDLALCASTAHYTRTSLLGRQHWRASKAWFRLRLIVAPRREFDPPHWLDALVAVHAPYDGWIYEGEDK